MTKQIFTSAQGQTVDLGTIKLRNEHVRAVGNMNVNARGDVLDSNNQVIETKSRQIQRQNSRLTNVVDTPVHTSSAAIRRARNAQNDNSTVDPTIDPTADLNTIADLPIVEPEPAPVSVATPAEEPALQPVENIVSAPAPVDPAKAGGGLAAAIARSKIIKQEKEKTARQLLQDNPGVRKI